MVKYHKTEDNKIKEIVEYYKSTTCSLMECAIKFNTKPHIVRYHYVKYKKQAENSVNSDENVINN
jgi:hypothetical protein